MAEAKHITDLSLEELAETERVEAELDAFVTSLVLYHQRERAKYARVLGLPEVGAGGEAA